MTTTDPNQCTNPIDLNRPAGLAVKCASVPLQLGCVSECIGERARPGVDRMNRQMQSMMCHVSTKKCLRVTHTDERCRSPWAVETRSKVPFPPFSPHPQSNSAGLRPPVAHRAEQEHLGAPHGVFRLEYAVAPPLIGRFGPRRLARAIRRRQQGPSSSWTDARILGQPHQRPGGIDRGWHEPWTPVG